MVRQVIVGLLIVLGGLSACKGVKDGFHIDGSIDGADGQWAVLKLITEDGKSQAVDSSMVKRGSFDLYGKVEMPSYAELYVGPNGPICFWIENQTITIQLDSALRTNNANIQGGEEQALHQSLQDSLRTYEQRAVELNQQYADSSIPDSLRLQKQEELLSSMEQLHNQRTEYLINFVQQHPNRAVSAHLLYSTLRYYVAESQWEPMLSSFTAPLDSSMWILELKKYYQQIQATSVGKPYPNINGLYNHTQPTCNLGDVIKKGQWTVLNFWASWCGPCLQHNKEINNIRETYLPQNDTPAKVNFIGFAMEREHKDWDKAIQEQNLPLPQLSDVKYWNSAIVDSFAITKIPYTILIDTAGIIHARGLSPEQLRDTLNSLIPTNHAD